MSQQYPGPQQWGQNQPPAFQPGSQPQQQWGGPQQPGYSQQPQQYGQQPGYGPRPGYGQPHGQPYGQPGYGAYGQNPYAQHKNLIVSGILMVLGGVLALVAFALPWAAIDWGYGGRETASGYNVIFQPAEYAEGFQLFTWMSFLMAIVLVVFGILAFVIKPPKSWVGIVAIVAGVLGLVSSLVDLISTMGNASDINSMYGQDVFSVAFGLWLLPVFMLIGIVGGVGHLIKKF